MVNKCSIKKKAPKSFRRRNRKRRKKAQDRYKNLSGEEKQKKVEI